MTKSTPITKKTYEAVSNLINGTRIAQCWAILSPEEIHPLTALWHRQLEAAGITPDEYDKLFEQAIRYRTAEIKEKKKPTPFSIELILAMKSESLINPPEDRNAEMERRGFPKMKVVHESQCLN